MFQAVLSTGNKGKNTASKPVWHAFEDGQQNTRAWSFKRNVHVVVFFIQLLPDFFALLSVLWAVLMLFPMAWFKVLALDAQGKCQNNLK